MDGEQETKQQATRFESATHPIRFEQPVGRPVLPVPEIVLLLDNRGCIMRSSAPHAGDRLSAVEFEPGVEFHAALHPGCEGVECKLAKSWQEAWDAQQAGLPVEWEFQSHALEGVMKIRVQPVSYACSVLFADSIEEFDNCSVVFLQDVSSSYNPSSFGDHSLAIADVHGRQAPLARMNSPPVADLVTTLDKQLNTVTARLLVSQEAERKRIAAELHDSLGQTLSLLRFEVDGLRDAPGERSEPDVLERIDGYVQRSLAELRQITRNLRPTALNNLGLIGALKILCNDFRVACPNVGLNCRFSDSSAHLPDELTVAIYRIAQEALNNVARHAQACEVLMSFAMPDGGVELEIRDDGVGLPGPGLPQRGLGLDTMRERAQSLRGEYEVTTAPGEGCAIRAHWTAQTLRSMR